MCDLVMEFHPEVVSFHFGLPEKNLLLRIKSAGAKIVSSATSVDEARWLEEQGCDAIIAQGFEAGGHRGMFLTVDISTQVGTMALVPQVVDAVKVPVIAAGGIADARGIVAAFALGAAAVQLGTAYLHCPEAQISPLYRQALKGSRDNDTAITNVFTGRPARAIVNRFMREVGPMSDTAPKFPLAAAALAPLRAKSEMAGSADFTPLWSGQSARLSRELPAADLTKQLAAEALKNLTLLRTKASWTFRNLRNAEREQQTRRGLPLGFHVIAHCCILAYRVLGDIPGAQNALENCCRTASRNLPEFDCEGAFRSWLARVLVDEAQAILRKNREPNANSKQS
jgi:nitronate monooxygenase